jgi:Deoxyribonuclease NucA/NucB
MAGLALVLVVMAGGVTTVSEIATNGIDGVTDKIDEAKEWAETLFGDDLVTAPDVAAKVKECRPGEDLSADGCDDLPIVVLDAEKMPFIGRNITTAWAAGKPGILTRGGDETIKANRAKSCGKFKPAYPGGSCDEYPFASSLEGGTGAQVEEVPMREQACQGGTLSSQYRREGIKVGDKFGVMVRHPDAIAKAPYSGAQLGEGGCSVSAGAAGTARVAVFVVSGSGTAPWFLGRDATGRAKSYRERPDLRVLLTVAGVKQGSA